MFNSTKGSSNYSSKGPKQVAQITSRESGELVILSGISEEHVYFIQTTKCSRKFIYFHNG